MVTPAKRDAALRARCRSRHRLTQEDGITLVEVIVAFAILSIVMVGVAASMFGALNLTRDTRERAVAASLASREMAAVRAQDFTTIPVGKETWTETVEESTFTVSRDAEWLPEDAPSDSCSSPSSHPLAYLRVIVEVTWNRMNATKPVRSETLLTPPVGAYDPDTGHIGVKVYDREGNNKGGIPVELTRFEGGIATGSKTIITTSSGCAFFAYQQPADGASDYYEIMLDLAGHVDETGDPHPVATNLAVSTGQVTAEEFTYDTAGSLELTIEPAASGWDAVSWTLPTDLWISLGGSGFGQSPTNTNPVHPAALFEPAVTGGAEIRVVDGLFPSSSGYTAWLGRCQDADPFGIKENEEAEASPERIYEPASAPAPDRGVAVAVPPGGSASTTLEVPALEVTVRGNDDDFGSGWSVQLRHDDEDSYGCSSYDVTAGTTGVDPDDAEDGLLRTAVPYGSWDVLISRGGTTYAKSIVVSPTADYSTPVSAAFSLPDGPS